MNLVLYPQKRQLQAALYDQSAELRRTVIDDADYQDLTALAGRVLEALRPEKLEKLICPGGLLKALKPGVYPIDEQALADAENNAYGAHLYNQAMILAVRLAESLGAQALMADPLSSDELLPLNRMSSLKNVPKRSRLYACEHRAALAEEALAAGWPVETRNIIVAKIDEEVSVGAYLKGICIEANDVLDGEGPMGFTWSGDLPVAQLTAAFFESGQDLEHMREELTRRGGIQGYAGVDGPKELEALISQGRVEARQAAELLAYQTAKWIGMGALALQGVVDAILISGQGARSQSIMAALTRRVGRIAEPRAVNPDMIAYLARVAACVDDCLRPLGRY